MNTKQNQSNNSRNKSASSFSRPEMTAVSGSASTGTSSHVDPLGAQLSNANPASDLDVRLEPTRKDDQSQQHDVISTAKSWISNNVSQLPQDLKQWGSKAVDQVNSLSTTQKVVGGALLAGGLGWLAYRAASSKKENDDEYSYGAASSQPWGTASRSTVDNQYRPVGRENSSSYRLEDDSDL